MTSVFFLGEQWHAIIFRLAQAVARVDGVALCSGRQYFQQGCSPRILLAHGQHCICCPRGLVLPGNVPGKIRLTGSFVCLAGGSCTPALQFARTHGMKTVTYGFSPYDTLTLSSITADKAVLTLQRQIHTLGGTVIEPADLPLTLFAPWQPENILAAGAVLLLSDCMDLLPHLAL